MQQVAILSRLVLVFQHALHSSCCSCTVRPCILALMLYLTIHQSWFGFRFVTKR
jgi:hypothetical protein